MLNFQKDLDSAYDQNNFIGRLLHFQKMINPLQTNFYSILEFKKTLDNLPQNHQYTNKQLWKMKYTCLSNLHPDNQQPIQQLFRVSAFVPVNIPIIILLGMVPPTPINQIFAQTLNQAYNFGFNYANRNASNSFTNQQILIAFSGSVFFACTASLGAQTLIKRSNFKSKNFLLKISPIFGILSANLFNLFSSRYKDFITGIQVKNHENHQPIEGTSLIAAKIAFQQSAFTRIMLPIGVIFIPQLIQNGLEKFKLMPKKNPGILAVNSIIASLTCYIVLGACLAFYPQNIILHKTQLEKEFQDKLDENNKPVDFYEFNKGL